MLEANDSIRLITAEERYVRSDVLIMDRAAGIEMEKVGQSRVLQIDEKTQILSRQRALQAWYTMWITEAIEGSGNFHADPHGRNVMLSVRADGSFELSPIDMGATGKLEAEQARGAVLLGFGAGIASPYIVEMGVKGMLTEEPNPEVYKKFQTDLRELTKKGPYPQLQNDISDLLLKHRIPASEEFIGFSRADQFMRQQVEELKVLSDAHNLPELSLSKVYKQVGKVVVINRAIAGGLKVKNGVIYIADSVFSWSDLLYRKAGEGLDFCKSFVESCIYSSRSDSFTSQVRVDLDSIGVELSSTRVDVTPDLMRELPIRYR